MTVNILRRSPINGRWQVEYTKRCDGEQEDFTISAENVILCAGTLGSTELLLRSQKKGLDISDQLGKGFSGNGDRISYSYATDRPGNSFGTPYKRLIPLKDLRPGPSTISVIDLRDVPDTDTWSHKLVLHDFTLPLFATELFRLVLLMTPTLNTEDWQAISEKIEVTWFYCFQENLFNYFAMIHVILRFSHEMDYMVIDETINHCVCVCV